MSVRQRTYIHPPCDDTPVITDIKATGESYGSGGDGRDRTGSYNSVVDVDEVWAQEERVGEFALCGCSCKHGPEESLCHRLFSTAIYTEMQSE